MKILVFSDSHGNIESLRKAISIHKSTTDLVVFLGDGVFDLESIKNEFSDLAFYTVRGNCDFMCADIPKDGVLDLDGVRFLICHGHTYNVKSSLDTVLYYALEKEVDIVLFGHTHIPLDTVQQLNERSIRLFNPGSIGLNMSFGVINIVNGVAVTGHGTLNP
jgi:putative phosphoesterase